jgi:hypothetical protein
MENWVRSLPVCFLSSVGVCLEIKPGFSDPPDGTETQTPETKSTQFSGSFSSTKFETLPDFCSTNGTK